MIDKSQKVTDVPRMKDKMAIPASPLSECSANDDDAKLKEELIRLTPSNEKLRELAAKCPPPPEYFDGDEDMPFDPIKE
jgi:hypothetical protein